METEAYRIDGKISELVRIIPASTDCGGVVSDTEVPKIKTSSLGNCTESVSADVKEKKMG